MNVAQYFMLTQVTTCAAAAIGFAIVKQPFNAGVWAFYACANICFVFIAGGAK